MVAFQFDRPDGRPQFTEPWLLWFGERSTTPEGYPFRWEGHLRLLTSELFRPEVQHMLVLIPKGNSKTTWEGLVGAWHLVTVRAPRIIMGAENTEQAKELFGFANHFTQSVATLRRLVVARPSTRELRLRGSVDDTLKVLAGDKSAGGGTKQGKNPTLGLADEPHAYQNDNLWVDLTSGGFKRRNAARAGGDPLWHVIGKDISISTAGHDVDGPLGRKRATFLGDPKRGTPPLGTVETGLIVLPDGSVEPHPDGRLTICRSASGASVMLEWALREDDDWRDNRVVKLANPFSMVTTDSLEDAREQLTESQFQRYRCNLWTVGESAWLPTLAWPSLVDPSVPVTVHRTWEDDTWSGQVDDAGNAVVDDLPGFDPATESFREFVDSLFEPNATIVGALDMGRYRDTAALVLIGEHNGKRLPRAIVWAGASKNSPIRYEWIEVAIMAVWRRYNLVACAADPRYADQLSERMRLRGVPMEDFPQSNERIGRADTDLRRDILEGRFAHDGDPILTAHVQAAASVEVGNQLIRTVRQKVTNPPAIDACKALSMASWLSDRVDGGGSMYDDPDTEM